MACSCPCHHDLSWCDECCEGAMDEAEARVMRLKIIDILNDDLSPWHFAGEEPMVIRLFEAIGCAGSR